eukprot:TRINITY_DN13602_c0_g1_i6.p2 TRINITY_DN13602_c0_g1~~TRINITY_DN13602_c0_g1_i6.p2  ORF type:complete len:339 (+),score=75.41 TRINITY_DN13602_c0_g1_i6:75-1091(+)
MALDFPPEASRAISQKYADILRVGRMKLNNEIIEWPGSVDEKIQEFQTAWVAGVKANLMTKSFDDISLLRFGYLYCKLVSINFVIADVMAVLQKKTGVMCSVETVDPKSGAHLAEFGASIVPGPQLKAWVAWPGQDNIIHRDPKKGQRVVKGTLSRLETRVKLPIEPGVVPDYTLKMMLKKANSKESGPSEDVAMRASSQLEEQGESLWWESLQKKLETPTAEKGVANSCGEGEGKAQAEAEARSNAAAVARSEFRRDQAEPAGRRRGQWSQETWHFHLQDQEAGIEGRARGEPQSSSSAKGTVARSSRTSSCHFCRRLGPEQGTNAERSSAEARILC